MTVNQLVTISEAVSLIEEGKPLLFAGVEPLLDQLPRGNWIGGTIPYFMTHQGGVYDTSHVFVNRLPDEFIVESARFYTASEISQVNVNGPEDGMSFVVMPYKSDVHTVFAQDAPSFDRYLLHPLIGWVAGIDLSAKGEQAPKVYLGTEGRANAEDAVVMHCSMPGNFRVLIDIVNVFEPDVQSDSIRFEKGGFSAKVAFVNGERVSFARYLEDNKINTALPMVADFYGARINLSFKSVDSARETVLFYTPVIERVTYRLAKVVDDYEAAFERNTPKGLEDILFSCNCILNYRHAHLEGKTLGVLTGPFTFGEIAYQLVNQTLVYAVVEKR